MVQPTPAEAIAIWTADLLAAHETAAEGRRLQAEGDAAVLKLTGRINTAKRIMELAAAEAEAKSEEGGDAGHDA